ncbi:hypothetical protein OTK49_02625 [Vibrio coralliirubri]|uniref:hypothetical protein n=1 Tax=Vibrio coralliirubri TaxID=1516159 RepID=UPI0022844AA9|nr:hypothetical protein [Vibrio coralliirubri]MCY9861412.1 hypothetical protein [Vibrio coralliirubri]
MPLELKKIRMLGANKRIYSAMNDIDMEKAAYKLIQSSSTPNQTFSKISLEGYVIKVEGVQYKGLESWVVMDENYTDFVMLTDSDKLDKDTVIAIIQAITLAEETAYLKGIEDGKTINKNELRAFLGFDLIESNE